MAILDAQAWSSVVDADGQSVFDRQQRWSNSHSAALFDADGGPKLNGAWTSGNNSQYIQLDGSFGLSTICVAFWYNQRAVDSAGNQIVLLYEGSFVTAHVYLETINQQLFVFRGGGVNLGPAGTFRMSPERWYHIGMRAVIHDTTGEVQVEINGNEVFNQTGLDTRNSGTSGIIDAVRYDGWGGGKQWIAEPIAFSTAGDAPTSLFGLHRVHMIKPDGDGTPTNFTPLGAGTNFSEVDEQAADDDTSHNESTVVTNKDRLTCESLPTAVKTVYSVQAKLLVKDPDGTATESVKTGLNSGTESLSTALALSTGYEQFEGPLETVDPNTAAAWTEANVNAADVVYEHA